MARPRDILAAGAVLHRQHALGDHLARVRSHDMDAQDAIRHSVGDELDDPLRLEVRLRSGVGGEGEGAHAVFDALVLQLRFVLPHPGHLGVGVHDRGDGAVIDVPMAFGNVLYRRHRFLLCLVGEHGAEGAVADDSDVGVLGAVLLVDHEPTFVVDVETDVLETEAGGIWSTADCYEDDIGIKLQ